MNKSDMFATWFVRMWYIFWMIGAFHMFPNHHYIAGSFIAISVLFSFSDRKL